MGIIFLVLRKNITIIVWFDRLVAIKKQISFIQKRSNCCFKLFFSDFLSTSIRLTIFCSAPTCYWSIAIEVHATSTPMVITECGIFGFRHVGYTTAIPIPRRTKHIESTLCSHCFDINAFYCNKSLWVVFFASQKLCNFDNQADFFSVLTF